MDEQEQIIEAAINLDDYDRRSFAVQARAIDDGGVLIEGMAAVYNAQSVDLGGFVETIHPGFFSGVLNDDTVATVNHDINYVLGRRRAGTLRIEDTAEGLAVNIAAPDTQWARDLIVSMRRGDIDQMSFVFAVKKGGDRWEKLPNGKLLRHLLPGGAARLMDVSVVTNPAYPQTSAWARSQAAQLSQAVELPDEDNQLTVETQAGETDTEAAERAQARHQNRKRNIQINQLRGER